jgi:hypothetical protein
MSLLTKAEVKNVLGILVSDTSKDTYIDAYIPQVIDLACRTLKTHFQGDIANSNEFAFSASSKTITDADSGFTDFLVSMDVYISGSKLNDGFYTISTLTSSILTVTETLKDEAIDNTIIISNVLMPVALKLTLSKIIGHYLQKDKVGYSAFGVGSINWTYSNAGALPKELINELYQSAGRSSVWGV